MKTHAQAVVIGGGIIGCSILYHLTKLGWKDVVLLERDELTSGSTWHAAANLHGLHDNNNISKLQYYTMQLYKDLEKKTGKVVLSSNQTLIWDTLKQIDFKNEVEGYGELFNN